MLEDYKNALKSGQRAYRACVARGQSPYLAVLDDILVNVNIVAQAHQFERLTGCTKYRTTAGQNSGKIFCCEHMIFSIDQSFISVIKSINFQVFHCI